MYKVVKLLLEFRAQQDVTDGCTSPLDDAIAGGYVETVSMLVAGGAVCDTMWTNVNPVTILSVARGLVKCPATLDGVEMDQMRNFFDVSSHLSRFVLSVLLPCLFVRRPTQCLMYWTLGLEKREQRATFNLRVGSCWQMEDYWALHTASGVCVGFGSDACLPFCWCVGSLARRALFLVVCLTNHTVMVRETATAWRDLDGIRG